MDYKRFTLRERPDLEEQIDRLSEQGWPEFLLHAGDLNWGALFTTLADYQILLCDPGDGSLIAVGHCVPLIWDSSLEDLPETIKDIIARAIRLYENRDKPNTFSALAAIVRQDRLGKGLSASVVREMKRLTAQYGCQALIAPVRPIWKSRYPLIPFEQYVRWLRPDGAPYDPWIRVHWRLGAVQLRVASNTLSITGSVTDWEKWTGLQFPGSGLYTVEGALQPVVIDRERDFGRYEDPNIWMMHPVR